MTTALTIVMYHYVRDLAAGTPSRFPRIKGLTTERFEGQLGHIAEHYTVVGEGQVAAAWAGPGRSEPLPPNPCWLTFDDGFVDHYETVFPRLADRGWPASFYPAAGPVLTGRLLDVHRIHFILASAEEAEAVYDAVVEEIRQFAPPASSRDRKVAVVYPTHQGTLADALLHEQPPLPTIAQLRADYFKPNRFDGPEVNFIKRVLQVGLPERVRTAICGRLFARFVTADEADFAAGLYMSVEQMREMASEGMTFGGHGFRHRWLGELPADEQTVEIDRSIDLLKRIYGPRQRPWSMCYPYGSYNAETLGLLNREGCCLGLTTKVGVAGPADPPLELPRLDTNDLPTKNGS